MAYSLQSRDLIADGIETMMASQFYDANLAIPGCDKNMPGCVMAMGRVNRRAATLRLHLRLRMHLHLCLPAHAPAPVPTCTCTCTCTCICICTCICRCRQ